jgi:hypothetical protein
MLSGALTLNNTCKKDLQFSSEEVKGSGSFLQTSKTPVMELINNFSTGEWSLRKDYRIQ